MARKLPTTLDFVTCMALYAKIDFPVNVYCLYSLKVTYLNNVLLCLPMEIGIMIMRSNS